MTINIVPDPSLNEPQNLGTPTETWTSTHSDNIHTKYLRLHSFAEPGVGLSEAIREIQLAYEGQQDDAGNPVWTSILHMRQSGLYIGDISAVSYTHLRAHETNVALTLNGNNLSTSWVKISDDKIAPRRQS